MPHYTESSYGLHKSPHHILALTDRTWYQRLIDGYETLSASLHQRVVP
ncbi:MAG: hypothetical protein ABIO96_09465 [Nitrospiraceae bacterium]